MNTQQHGCLWRKRAVLQKSHLLLPQQRSGEVADPLTCREQAAASVWMGPKLLLHHLYPCFGRCVFRAFETLVLLLQVGSAMERVVFLVSPFLIWMVFSSSARQNSNFVPLLIFQHVCSLICVIISSTSPASPLLLVTQAK